MACAGSIISSGSRARSISVLLAGPGEAGDGEGEHELVQRVGSTRIEAAVGDSQWILGAGELAVGVRGAGTRADLQMHVGDVHGIAAYPQPAEVLAARDALSRPDGHALDVAVRGPSLEAWM